MIHQAESDEQKLLSSFQVADKPLYLVGIYDAGVTAFSQQVRALNLAYALVETKTITANERTTVVKDVAIVGAGFAGLTLAKALFAKSSNVNVTLFEKRDALLPLQNGSDTRWLHPKIYDWPAEGSDANAAMLPILNWVAARASDVVVQVLREWQQEEPPSGTRLYCNTNHLQVYNSAQKGRLQLEWVGESRRVSDGNYEYNGLSRSEGSSKSFDLVILTMGFGLEKDEALSYWRNDTIGQPSLDRATRNFVVSGQGDGAVIDLLRLRISQYRQDRILHELFGGSNALLKELRILQAQHSSTYSKGLFKALEVLSSGEHRTAFDDVVSKMRQRLRRDTDVVLHIKLRTFADLFDSTNTRISFQNRLLVFVLYKCGGFTPSSREESEILKQHPVLGGDVIRRHGTLRDRQLSEILSDDLFGAIQDRRGGAIPDPFSQSDEPKWPGGYFGFPGPISDVGKLDDAIKHRWRKEYVPGSVSLMAASFCAAVAGFLISKHKNDKRLRITLHRAMLFSGEELLQQCCDYAGLCLPQQEGSSIGRTFPAENATIGLAYKTMGIIRTIKGVSQEALAHAMGLLQLNAASSAMSKQVSFIAAIPLLEPPEKFFAPSPVAAVLYVDSEAEGFTIEDSDVVIISQMLEHLGRALSSAGPGQFDRIRNSSLTRICSETPGPSLVPADVRDVFEIVPIAAPRTEKPLVFNFDQSDFIPAED